ncbi:MAG: GNAT family N-acetyltransferase [Cyanobacteria bacterium P01_H01_bin.153]
MSQPLTIRTATAADLPEVLRLYQQPDLDDGKALSMEQAIALWHKIQQYPSYRLIVAAWGDRIVGTFTLLVMDNLLHLGAPAAIVEAIAVAPQFHHRGIGGQMMRWAMAEASRAGCYKLVLSSNQNRPQAHAFYQNLGFQQHGYSFYVPLDASAGSPF